MTSSRRHHLKVKSRFTGSLNGPKLKVKQHLNLLQSLMLQIAANWIEQEKKDIATAKEAYMAENCPAPELSGDQATLMVR